MQSIIELKNVHVAYNKGQPNEMLALKDVTLKIFEGEYVVFLGPSGSGKSTLLYTIAGLEFPTSGAVTVGGENIMKMTAKEKIQFYRTTIGMIFQAFYLVPHLSAMDNILLAKMFSGSNIQDREQRAFELMERFGITEFAARIPSKLSGGQQQRTAIARALMNDAAIILADEPVGNLDSKNSAIVLELLADIHAREKKTIIQVTHNANDARFADRIFYIKDGSIERITANTDYGHRAMEGSTIHKTEFEKVSEANLNLSDAEVKAVFILRQALGMYDVDTERSIVKALTGYIRSEIDRPALVRELMSKDGARLYTPRALHIAGEAERIMKEMRILHDIKSGRRPSGPADTSDQSVEMTQAGSIAVYILEKYKGSLTLGQRSRMVSVIRKRLCNELSAEQLRVQLDNPEKNGGVGLNSRTAKHFSREIEAVIVHK